MEWSGTLERDTILGFESKDSLDSGVMLVYLLGFYTGQPR